MHVAVWLGVVLVVIWGILWLGFHIVSGLVHLVVMVGVVLIVWGLVNKGAKAVSGGS